MHLYAYLLGLTPFRLDFNMQISFYVMHEIGSKAVFVSFPVAHLVQSVLIVPSGNS